MGTSPVSEVPPSEAVIVGIVPADHARSVVDVHGGVVLLKGGLDVRKLAEVEEHLFRLGVPCFSRRFPDHSVEKEDVQLHYRVICDE